MPRIMLYIVLLLVAVTLVPLGLVYKSQHAAKTQTRIQVIPDMDSQVKYKPQTVSGFFADGVTMRERPAGTVVFAQENTGEAFTTGMIVGPQDTTFISELPVKVTLDFLRRGQDQFAIYCAPCHGAEGKGDGPVHQRASALGEGTWTPPTDLTGETVLGRPYGHIFATIRAGIRNMPAYGSQVGITDRWAITAHMHSLEPSREGE